MSTIDILNKLIPVYRGYFCKDEETKHLAKRGKVLRLKGVINVETHKTSITGRTGFSMVGPTWYDLILNIWNYFDLIGSKEEFIIVTSPREFASNKNSVYIDYHFL